MIKKNLNKTHYQRQLSNNSLNEFGSIHLEDYVNQIDPISMQLKAKHLKKLRF